MGRVYRKQMIEGIAVPAIIHNSNYFLIQMAIYADGIVSCWHKSDLRQFKEDLRRGWVVPSVPEGKALSVHNLGDFVIKQARWYHNAASYYQQVREMVKDLNPEMANIYKTTPGEIEKWDKLRVGFTASPTPCKQKPGFGYDFCDGRGNYIFCRQNDGLYLTALTVFADKTVQLDGMGPHYYNMEEIEQLFANGTLCTNLPQAEWVSIFGLGELLLAPMQGNYAVPVGDKLGEIADDLADLLGEEDSIAICRRAYHYYLEEPSDWTRENLRKAYEAVPEHQRMYLGDMDTRDSDYLRILYHPEQKREV